MSLVISMNERGEPTALELDGRPVFASTLDIQFRNGEPAKVIMEMYVPDIAGGLITRARQRKRDLTGQVPAKLSYDQWLRTQTKEFQDEVLGPRRAQMFRDGHPDGEPVLETREFYAVSKKDHELLMQLKKKDTL
jgi:hypothetical protein